MHFSFPPSSIMLYRPARASRVRVVFAGANLHPGPDGAALDALTSYFYMGACRFAPGPRIACLVGPSALFSFALARSFGHAHGH